MPTALIKITQDVLTDLAGRALKGDTVNDVVFTNGDDTGVTKWTFELLDTPPGSVITPTTQGPGGATSFNMGTPDIPGCYRLRLTVVDVTGAQDVDIRNFAVPTVNRDWIVPPFQGNPQPLPLIGQTSKPDELNFGGQPFGWGGDEDATRKLMYQVLLEIDANL